MFKRVTHVVAAAALGVLFHGNPVSVDPES